MPADPLREHANAMLERAGVPVFASADADRVASALNGVLDEAVAEWNGTDCFQIPGFFVAGSAATGEPAAELPKRGPHGVVQRLHAAGGAHHHVADPAGLGVLEPPLEVRRVPRDERTRDVAIGGEVAHGGVEVTLQPPGIAISAAAKPGPSATSPSDMK